MAQSDTPRSPTAATWPVAWVADHCPVFSDENGPIKLASCRVSASGEVASVAGDTFYYALYCAEDPRFFDAGPCDDPGSLNSNHSDSNVAVFLRHGDSQTVSLVVSRFEGFAGHFRVPQIVESPDGTVMELPFVSAVSCDCNASTYYLWRPRTRDWVSMDWESWQTDAAAKLPAGLANVNGYWPDLRTLTTQGGLWRASDAHCCPSGGSVSVQLGIVGNRFVLKSFEIKANPEDPQR